MKEYNPSYYGTGLESWVLFLPVGFVKENYKHSTGTGLKSGIPVTCMVF